MAFYRGIISLFAGFENPLFPIISLYYLWWTEDFDFMREGLTCPLAFCGLGSRSRRYGEKEVMSQHEK